MKKNRGKIIIALIVIAIVAIVGFLILRPKNNSVRYITTPVAKGSITVQVTASGTVNPSSLDNAGFKVSGQIAQIFVKVGDHVSPGQALAKLNTNALQNQLNISQSGLNEANNNLSKLYSTHYTYYDILNAKEAINQAQTKVYIDNDNLINATLTSNISGIVANINSHIGDNVSAGGSNSTNTSAAESASVMTIIDPNSMIANLTIGETDIPNIKVGQVVQLSIDALGSKKYVGKVQSIDTLGTVSSNVVSYNVKVSIDKVDASIKDGMTVNGSILVQTKDNILTVPNSAIKSINGQQSVQVLKNNSPEVVPVTTGISNDSETEIVSGLNEGDQIVTTTIGGTTGGSTSSNGGGLRLGGGGGGATFFRGGGG